MRLNEEEYYKYLEIHLQLIYYVGRRMNELSEEISYEDFMKFTVEDKYPIRNLVYDNIELLDDYIKENSKHLSNEDKAIILGFKYFKKGTFYVVKLTKKYALFMGENYVYGVHALNDPFQMFWGDNLPIMIEAVLLSFKGKIIYDGMISTYPIHLGKGIRSSIKNDFALSEGKYGIIEELPVKVNLENSHEKELLIMMKTKSSREHNWYEIESLLEENPNLLPIYIRELGRINSRRKKKELKKLGLKKLHFAMYNDTIISSNESSKELKEIIVELISEKETRKSIYYFKI